METKINNLIKEISKSDIDESLKNKILDLTLSFKTYAESMERMLSDIRKRLEAKE